MFKGQLLKKMMVLGVPFVLFFSSCMKETFVYGEGDGFKFKASADALNDVERLTKGGDSQLIYANGGDSLFLSSEAELNFVDAFTKAAPTANLTEKIGVFGYKYTGSAPTGNADLANDVELSKESNEFWKPAMSLAWPGADKVQFFGYYPKGYSAVSVKSVANGTPVLNFTVPANVADQKELLVAKTGEYSGDAEQIVAMPFRHALTAIQFSAGDDIKPGITIKKISVKGVNSKGEVKLSDVTWSNQNTNADYTIDNINFVSAVGGNKTITSGDKTLMLLPQTVPAGAIIEVVMNDEHGDHILKAAVNGQSWNAGDRITYRISSKAITWTYTFGASVTGAAVAHAGGDQAYKVTSFRTNGNGVKQFVPYTIEYSVDGGDNWTMERPAFLTQIEGKQTGTTEETTLTATFAAQEKTLQTSDII
ncbi:MAG: fimbrillin family protein, partial [Candidatus Cryptobacteroides sp.]